METEPLVLSEFFVSAIRVGVPGDEDGIRRVIDLFNHHVRLLPVQIAPIEYEEFIDRDRDTEEFGYIDRHDCFDHDVFADLLADHWILANVLHRNGDNQQVRDFHMFLDTFIHGTDIVDASDVFSLDF